MRWVVFNGTDLRYYDNNRVRNMVIGTVYDVCQCGRLCMVCVSVVDCVTTVFGPMCFENTFFFQVVFLNERLDTGPHGLVLSSKANYELIAAVVTCEICRH